MVRSDNQPIITNGYPIFEGVPVAPIINNGEYKKKLPMPCNKYYIIFIQNHIKMITNIKKIQVKITKVAFKMTEITTITQTKSEGNTDHYYIFNT